MPGLVGILTQEPNQHEGKLVTMVKSIVHEKFHRSDRYSNPEVNLLAGWATHEGSYSDCLPIWNARKDVCLLFYGEHFSTSSNFSAAKADRLLEHYDRMGADFFRSLNGWFCGVIIDLRLNEVTVFNDRYGLGRLYFHESGEGFFFASEAKALLAVLPRLREFDLQGLGEWFSCGCPLQNRSLFSKISILPPASAWTFKSGRLVKKHTYFDPAEWGQQSELPQEQYYAELRETFARVLPAYFGGDQQVAMSLTGGLDSRMIMAWMKKEPGSLPCITHGGIFRECGDVKIGRKVAAICKQPHHVFVVDERFFGEFPSLAERCVYLTDGAMDVTGSVGLFVNREARQLAPVRMTGNYGSEILRWLVAFKWGRGRSEIFAPEFYKTIGEAGETYAKERKVGDREFITFKQMPWHHFARFGLEQSQLTIRSPYLDNELVGLAYRSPVNLGENQRIAGRLIKDGNAALAECPTDRGPLGRTGLFGRIEEGLLEFTFKAEYAYDYGMPQWVARVDHALKPLHLECLFLGRHKYYHFRVWYRDRFSEFIKSILLDSQTLSRPYLSRKGVEFIVNEHASGRGNYTSEIHRLLSSEFIHRRLLAS